MRRVVRKYGPTIAVLACFLFGGVQAADQGPRLHAEGQYDAATTIYTVAEGDDLFAIGERFEIPVDTLKEQNKLTSDEIKPDQKLTVAAARGTAAPAASRKPIPVPSASTEMTFNSLRGVQYCEVWLFTGTPETGLRATYYNTSALNNSANKMDTCPPDMWAKVNVKSLEAEYDVYKVFKNGPRGWTMDEVKVSVGPVETFDGLKTRWWGHGVVPKGVDFKTFLDPYKPFKSIRKSEMTFQKGKPVFILDDPEGTPWVMQAFAKIGNPPLTDDSLRTRGDKLKLAPGWKYRVVVLDKDLTIKTPEGFAWIVADDLMGVYDACKEGSCNYKP